MKKTRALANGLGWFSIALGLTEIVAARPLSRLLGIPYPRLVRLFGVREIAAGIGLLARSKKGPWIWARIAGDVLDAAVLGAALSPRNPKRRNAALAIAAVSPVIAADVFCGKELGVSA